MNEQIKQQWIGALTSGEYNQTTDCLNDGKGMCCLGVLTDLYRKEHGGEWKLSINAAKFGEGRYALSGPEMSELDANEITSTPMCVQVWADLEECIPQIPFMSRDTIEHLKEESEKMPPEEFSIYNASVAAMNDGGLTFPQIADIIKAFL